MKTIYFVRHCQSDNTVHADRPRPLTEKGLQDALRVTEYFRHIPVDRVVSSPYKRAVDTVQGAAALHGLPVDTDEDLRERAVGSWVEDFDSFAQQQWADLTYAMPDGESLQATMRRNLAALERMLAHPAQVTVAGTHGTALCTMIRAHDATFGYEDFRRIQKVMPWIVKFTFEDDCLVSWETMEF